MFDQREKIEGLLVEIDLAKGWHIIEPVHGDLKDTVWLQHSDKKRNLRVFLPPDEIQALPREQLKNRISMAIRQACESDEAKWSVERAEAEEQEDLKAVAEALKKLP